MYNTTEVMSVSHGTTMADIGIQTDRYGKLTFDEDKFATALKADPDALATLSRREFRAGLYEVIKYGLIADHGVLEPTGLRIVEQA